MHCVAGTPMLDKLEETLGTVVLRWSTDDEKLQTEQSIEDKTKNASGGDNAFGVELFKVIKGTVHLGRSSYGIAPVSWSLHIPKHLFYILLLYREKGARLRYVLCGSR